uniref:Uncharacterized protein n=1 Tax=Arundo donax TaxID=35708 RepID=A0A0A9BVP3_ARUDO
MRPKPNEVPHTHLGQLHFTLSYPRYLIFVSIKQYTDHTITTTTQGEINFTNHFKVISGNI